MSKNTAEDVREVEMTKPQNSITITKKQRMTVFLVLALMNVLLNMDHGTLPAASNEIKETLSISDSKFGAFGSLVYLGNLIGAFFITKLIDIFDRRYFCIVTALLNAAFLYIFANSRDLTLLYVIRVLIGIMQTFITVYFPVWIDQFGPKKSKTMMMSVFNITSPLGVMLGYILTMLIKKGLNV